MNHDRAVIQMIIDLERRSDHADDRKLGGRLDHRGDCVKACVEQRALLKQIVARIGAQPQFGKQREHRLALGGVADQRDGMFGVVSGIRDANGRHSNRDSDEIVIVEIEKVSVPGHLVSLGCRPAVGPISAARASAPLKKTVPIVGGRYKIARSGPGHRLNAVPLPS